MAGIFISYRRSDSAAMCDRIYAALLQHFGKDAIFKDIDNIPLGVNFADYIRSMLPQSAVVVAIIGRTWLDTVDAQGLNRLDDPSDFVRVELEEALAHNIPVVPLLVDGAPFPTVDRLPMGLRGLLEQNGRKVNYDPYFEIDMRHVISGLERWVPSLQTRQAAFARHQQAAKRTAAAARKRTYVPAPSRVHAAVTYLPIAPVVPKPPLPRRWLLSYGVRTGAIAATLMMLVMFADSLVASSVTWRSVGDSFISFLLIAPVFIAAVMGSHIKRRFDRSTEAVLAAIFAATPMWISFWIGAFVTGWHGIGFANAANNSAAENALGVVAFSIFFAIPETIVIAICGSIGNAFTTPRPATAATLHTNKAVVSTTTTSQAPTNIVSTPITRSPGLQEEPPVLH